jgi:cobalt-zinc-cadmium efflux system outer membrane protein
MVLLFIGGIVEAENTRFQSEFDSTTTVETGDSLSLSAVLTLVARENPTLRAIKWEMESSRRQMKQANLRPNPELETEIEEIGWDAPGFSESEFTLALSQEFEFFGQRGARRQLARAGIDATKLSTRLSAFDLYLDVKRKFYALEHAQRRSVLTDSSVALARNIVANITYRIDKGAALPSELILARLDLQRVELSRDDASLGLTTAQIELAALWGGDAINVSVNFGEESELHSIIDKLPTLMQQVDSTRHMLQLNRQAMIARAEKKLAAAEAKPGITISGGYKRLQGDGFNSFLLGVSFPLPLFNKNQGTTAGLEAQLRSLEHEQQSARLEATTTIRAESARLTQLIKRHSTLDTLLLPTAEEAYTKLQKAYEAGRVPYTSLLEAKRALIELRFEYTDMHLEMHEQVLSLEQTTGTILLGAQKQRTLR